MKVEVDPTGLAAGVHKAEIRVVVPAAFHTELKIPVTLMVAEPYADDF